MVCDRTTYRTTVQTIYFVGFMCGAILFGTLSDRYRSSTCLRVSMNNIQTDMAGDRSCALVSFWWPWPVSCVRLDRNRNLVFGHPTWSLLLLGFFLLVLHEAFPSLVLCLVQRWVGHFFLTSFISSQNFKWHRKNVWGSDRSWTISSHWANFFWFSWLISSEPGDS